jgi:hypothetical protein
MVATDQGMTVEEMLNHYHIESVVPGICVSCDAITDSCEPDAEANWCENCDKNKVKSILVIAGII